LRGVDALDHGIAAAAREGRAQAAHRKSAVGHALAHQIADGDLAAIGAEQHALAGERVLDLHADNGAAVVRAEPAPLVQHVVDRVLQLFPLFFAQQHTGCRGAPGSPGVPGVRPQWALLSSTLNIHDRWLTDAWATLQAQSDTGYFLKPGADRLAFADS